MKITYKTLDENPLDISSTSLVQKRQRKQTLREVYIDPGKYVYKRYVFSRWCWSTEKPWLKETKALLKTHKENDCQHIALYKGINKSGKVEIVHQKSFIEGESLKMRTIDLDLSKKIAKLISSLHQQGVVTRDPHKDNFFITPSNHLHFIDFGKAKIYNKKSLHFIYAIGSEFAKLMHRTFKENETLWKTFTKAYFQISPMPEWKKKLIMVAYKFCRNNRKNRQRKNKN